MTKWSLRSVVLCGVLAAGVSAVQAHHSLAGVYALGKEAKVTGAHKSTWLSHAPTGSRVEFGVVIFFPWDTKARKFKGERVFAQL